jgi:hypothetical protein
MILSLLATTLVFSFVICCLVSALLQVVAWTRHARDGVPVSLRALWRPEGYFDEIGLHQIRLARRLLTIGGVAYLSYGFLVVVTTILGGVS